MDFRKVSAVVLGLGALASPSSFATVKDDFVKTLDLVEAKFEERYALTPWKEKLFRWTPAKAAKEIKREGLSRTDLTEDQARVLIQNFFYSARDYHAKAIYSPGGYTSLPISVRTNGRKVYVTSVDDDCGCQVSPGDEVLKFDGEDPRRAIRERMTLRYPNHLGSDVRDGERRLTNPYGLLMEQMPKSDTSTVVVLHEGKKIEVKLPWKKPFVDEPVMAAPKHAHTPDSLLGWMKGPGSFDSIFPKPEKVLWENDSKVFPAWIAELPGSKGKKVGSIQIKNFAPGGEAADFSAAVKEFEALIAKMDADSDVLILDTISNSGGMADYMYALASYFFDKDVPTLKFQYRLFDDFVKDVTSSLPDLDAIQTVEDAKKYFGDDYFGFPVDLDFAKDMKTFYHGLVDDAKAGLKFSKVRSYDSTRVKPNPRVHYLKPLFVLTDERTASCGDFFAAFFQDTKRAETLGGWTMGAGAFTGDSAVIDSPLKTNSLIIPLAIGFRLDDRTPVENLGVIPNHWFQPSDVDYRNGFKTYQAKIFEYIEKRIR